MLVYEERGKPEYPEKNLSEQGRTQPTYNVDAGIWTWAILVGDECSHPCTHYFAPEHVWIWGKPKKETFIKKIEQQQCAHLCLISQIIIFFGGDYSPQLMFPVKDVIHPSRVAAILFPLHPARMLHILFFSLGGSLSAWWFLGIRNEEDGYFTKVSEKYVDWAMFEQKILLKFLNY